MLCLGGLLVSGVILIRVLANGERRVTISDEVFTVAQSKAEESTLTISTEDLKESDVSQPTPKPDSSVMSVPDNVTHSDKHVPSVDEDFSSTSEDDLPQTDSMSTSRPARTTLAARRLPLIDTSVISRSQYQKVKFITGCVMLVLPLVGMVMNSVNIIIFSSPQLKCPSSIILVCLSVAELFVIVIQMIARTVDFVLGMESVYSYVYLSVTKYLAIYASAVFGRTTYYLILFVAAKRLLAVAFPLRSKYFRRIQKPFIECGLIFVICAAYHVYIVRFSPAGNHTHYRLSPSSFYEHHRDVFVSVHVIGEVILVYIPLLSCLVLNVILIVIIQRHGCQEVLANSIRNFRKISQAERQTTVIILVSTFVFIFLVLPKPFGGLVAYM